EIHEHVSPTEVVPATESLEYFSEKVQIGRHVKSPAKPVEVFAVVCDIERAERTQPATEICGYVLSIGRLGRFGPHPLQDAEGEHLDVESVRVCRRRDVARVVENLRGAAERVDDPVDDLGVLQGAVARDPDDRIRLVKYRGLVESVKHIVFVPREGRETQSFRQIDERSVLWVMRGGQNDSIDGLGALDTLQGAFEGWLARDVEKHLV